MVALSLFRPAASPDGRVGIVDIGSNSVRLVVYDGPGRIPAILFNEKIMAGLGRGLARTGALDEEAMERTIAALGRYRLLAGEMGIARLRVVATAAVRDASNGAVLLDRLRGMGLTVELLSGDEEATLAGYGVLAAIPRANGIVGDLGGGSLELIRIGEGAVHDRLSLPLGVLRLPAIRAEGPRALGRIVRKAGWSGRGQGLPLYLVGGSWRAMTRLHMHAARYPLPIVHHYAMPPADAARMQRLATRLGTKKLRDIPGVSAARAPALADAAALLAVLARDLGSSALIASAYGLREGLLYQSLSPAVRADDPLLAGAREEGARQGRFPEHGDLLERWTAPIFAGEGAEAKRLRHAACLLADVAWRAHPDFRAERGLDMGLHGNWVGIDAIGRAMLGHALWTSYGCTQPASVVAALLDAAQMAEAARWGLAIRLGQRLSGGVSGPLRDSRLERADGQLRLRLAKGDEELAGEAIDRRLKALAAALGLRA